MKTQRSILVLGSTGQVGWELQRVLSSVGEVVASSIWAMIWAAVWLLGP